MKLLLTCFFAFALFCRVHAGFCDGKAGRYCRIKDFKMTSTLCTCTLKSKRRFLSKKKSSKSSKSSYSKYKYKGTSFKTDCDAFSDTPCDHGCEASRGGCLTPRQVCATATLNDVTYNDGTTVHRLSNICPSVTRSPFKTWKNRQLNSAGAEMAYLQRMVAANKAWSKATLLPKFYAATAQGIPAIQKAWDDNCNTVDITQMNCLSYFPKCNANRGDNAGCVNHCQSAMTCVTKVQTACMDANQADSTLCNQYSTFGPRAGIVNCDTLCKENQNDKDLYSSPGSTLGSFMSVAIAIAIAIIM